MSDQLAAIEILVRSEESDGRVGIVRNALPGRWAGPPLHHHDFDEAFHVLEGELTFQLGDERRTAGPGETVFAPAGSVHTLANLSDRPARYLIVCTPGGFERYFARLAAGIEGREPPAWATDEYPQTIVVGPPLAA
ncbi:cupin domain-containing protein [Patulibacter defluvii]|uniref:cupin domain-containing protein n=1 Tax=Patulibacter defluvii TaxID=3095358 RepID=UPI002A757715|nr:cupin domain-containing protein [Patulibacter sp. DM4]